MTGCLLSMLLFGLGLDAPTSRSPIDPKILELVAKLGADSFRTREKAAQELIQAGLVALPAVRGGARSSNIELATRCEKLIPAIKEKYRETQLALFLNSADKKIPTGLPCVRRFLAIAGDTREARMMYAEMLREHHGIIESMEDSPELTGKLMAKTVHLCRSRKEMAENVPLGNGATIHVPPLFVTPTEISLFFFVRTEGNIVDLDENAFDVPDELVTPRYVSGPTPNRALRKMFLHWFCNERRPQLLSVTAPIVVGERMKEAVPNLIRCIKDENTLKWHKSMLLLDLYSLGDKKHIPDIESLINDPEVMQETTFSDEMNGQHLTTTQLGDVALSICWLWSGKKLLDLNTAVKYQKDVVLDRNSHFSQCAFETEDDRKAAHAKWKKLRAEMLKADEKKGKQ